MEIGINGGEEKNKIILSRDKCQNGADGEKGQGSILLFFDVMVKTKTGEGKKHNG